MIESGENQVHIAVRDMTMAYGDFVIQKDLDFEVRRGDIFVIMGGSGCGKSTLANLIMGFWEPQKGKIQINGVDTKNMSEKQLNFLTSIVQQGVFLFNMSMEENILARNFF